MVILCQVSVHLHLIDSQLASKLHSAIRRSLLARSFAARDVTSRLELTEATMAIFECGSCYRRSSGYSHIAIEWMQKGNPHEFGGDVSETYIHSVEILDGDRRIFASVTVQRIYRLCPRFLQLPANERDPTEVSEYEV